MSYIVECSWTVVRIRPVLSFTSGLFDSVFARVSCVKVFEFPTIFWAFRKLCLFGGERGGGEGGLATSGYSASL